MTSAQKVIKYISIAFAIFLIVTIISAILGGFFAIAGVLASNPSIVIMDEPTSSLDPVSTREMMKLITSLKEEGKIVIVISHDTDLCYEYGDRVIIMHEGEILLNNNVNEAFNDKYILNKACLVEPFVNKMKRTLRINDSNIKSIKDLKEVINNG